MQEQLRQRKAEFRLAEGLSEAEARGIPLPHPAVAVRCCAPQPARRAGPAPRSRRDSPPDPAGRHTRGSRPEDRAEVAYASFIFLAM